LRVYIRKRRSATIDGLWTVEFRTNVGDAGFGTIVLENGRVAGGDGGYYYLGSYALDGEKITAEVKIQQYNGVYASRSESPETATLKISGNVQGTRMMVSGQVVENPELEIAIRGIQRESF
jgi:hypothetical protein